MTEDTSSFEATLTCAQTLDAADTLAHMRASFHIPKHSDGKDEIYLCGNSLGLQPQRSAEYVQRELNQWQKLGVKGHFSGDYPWMPYHEFLAEPMAELVGAKSSEVVVMNSLTVNLHLMMVSFYQPRLLKQCILIEQHAFPSDHYAAESQLIFHGFDPKEGLMLMRPRSHEATIRTEDILLRIDQHADTLALVLLPGVQYYTGEVLDMKAIVSKAHEYEIKVGLDLAHAVGNIPLELHDWGVDFAVWCSYKYLNSGPGSVAGCFVHERYHDDEMLKRFAGWWGHDKTTRFQMGDEFSPIKSAEGWQLSNPPILSLAAIRGSMDTFREAGGIQPLREKSIRLTGFLRFLLETRLSEQVDILTPSDTEAQGCQLSLEVNSEKRTGKEVFDWLEEQGVTCDWREPNVIRIAPVPLYNTFEDVYRFVDILEAAL
ncbi:kynureninase [Marinicella sp. W31]|uniref:kynureninase n=1 Tax=Marinicella sp. W31 TaxID=3023713 RepID=UPI003756B3F7